MTQFEERVVKALEEIAHHLENIELDLDILGVDSSDTVDKSGMALIGEINDNLKKIVYNQEI